jgi:dihydroorotase
MKTFNRKIRKSSIFCTPLFLLFWLAPTHLDAQEFDLLLKGGHVVDAKNNISAVMDVAITGGKISKVSKDINAAAAKKVIDATGLYVMPGLINIHTHVFAGSNDAFANGTSSQLPDAFAPRSGITTVVDAGTTGWKNFPAFKAQIVDHSITRVLAFINIFSEGFSSGEPVEPDPKDLDPVKTAEMIKAHPDIIVGTRIGHYSGKNWNPFDQAVKAAELANVPLLVECHLPEYSLEDQLSHMRKGDIITHAYENVSERMPIVDEKGKLRGFVLDAQKRGILFDVGHGGAGFWFNQAIPAIEQGLLPNSFGTDEHRSSMNSGMKNMLNVMSKFLAMGMKPDDVFARGTWLAARSIGRTDLGNLSVGSVADVAVLRILEGAFGFVDSGQNRIEGSRKLEAELTIRNGKIVWDLNGLSAKKFTPQSK